MNTVEEPLCLPGLPDECDAIVEEWCRAISETAFAPLSAAALRQHVTAIVAQIVTMLTADPAATDERDMQSVGGTLADLCQGRPSVLNKLLSALLCLLTTRIMEDRDAIQRLGTLIGGLADGFTAQSHQIILTQQERIRKALAAELRRREEALRQSEERYRAISELTSDFAYAVRVEEDGSLVCEWITDAFKRITGMTSQDVMDRGGWQSLLHPDDLPLAIQHVQACQQGQTDVGVFRIVTKTGEVRWLCNYARPVWDEAQERVVKIYGAAQDITARKAAEIKLVNQRDSLEQMVEIRTHELETSNHQLRQSEHMFRSLVEQSVDGIVMTDEDGVIWMWNRGAERLFGISGSEAIGQPLWELQHRLTPEDRRLDLTPQQRRDYVRTLLTTGRSGWGDQLVERLVQQPDGARRTVQESAFVVQGASGFALGGIIRDVTAQKQAEQEIQRRTAQLEALRDVGLEITTQLDLDTLLRSIVTRAIELVDGSDGGLYLYRPERDVLEWAVVSGPHPVQVGALLRRGEGLCGKAWETGQPIFVDDYQHWEGRAAVYEGIPFAATIGVPIHWGEELLGVLNINARPPRTFSHQDAELLSLFATQAAIAIHNARLYGHVHAEAETKTLLLQEINHRVKNNLASIIGLLYAERRRLEDTALPVYDAIMRDLVSHLQGLAAVHSELSASHWSPLRLSNLSRSIIEVILELLPQGKRVTLSIPESVVRVTPDQSHDLALVINELTTNSVKHGLADRDAVQISIAISEEKNQIEFELRDNGSGYPPDVLNWERHGVGLELVQNIVRRNLHGDVSLHNDQGAVTRIHFPSRARGP
jgi:PAS domain S-box-containing protein